MTRKAYQMIADKIACEIACHRDDTKALAALRGLAFALADGFQAQNERFDRAIFYRACGMEDVA